MDRRFLALWFPSLLTDWYTRRNPQYKDVPLVSTLPVNGRMLITAVNNVARKLGINTFMPLADAKAAVPELIKFDDTPLRAKNLLKKIGLWCIKFTPVVGMDGFGGLILDMTGCAHLWGGELAYALEISSSLTERGYHTKFAIADTVGAAWAASRYSPEPHSILTQTNKYDMLSTFPPEALRIEQNMIDRLYKLGFKTIGSFMSISSSVLKRRFGQQLIDRIDQLSGRISEPIDMLVPLPLYVERLPSLEPIRTAKGIEIAIQQLLDKLCVRLGKEGKGIRKAKLSCYRLDGKVIYIGIGTNRATASREHLFALFALKVASIAPALGIELFILEATVVEDCIPNQELLWTRGQALENENLSELLDRFKVRDSHCQVIRYLPDEHHWPERSIRAANSLTERATTGWFTSKCRPTRLLHPPQIIEVTAPVPDYPPLLFRYQGEVHMIKRADGPERIEREWWIEGGEHRDYYDVEDEDGRRYWLFRLGHYKEDCSPTWYLHGFFA